MKKAKLLAVITVLAMLNSTLVYGHSGRTDANGGHYNRSTGEYHYHNGGGSSSTSTSSSSTSTTTKITTPAPTPKKINVSVNGEQIIFDTPPYADNNGRTMVPIAKVAEIFEATTSWDDSTSTVTIKNGDTTISLVLGESYITVNGEIFAMDTKAVAKNGRTYVPISAIAKAFKVGYTWDSATSTVVIVK